MSGFPRYDVFQFCCQGIEVFFTVCLAAVPQFMNFRQPGLLPELLFSLGFRTGLLGPDGRGRRGGRFRVPGRIGPGAGLGLSSADDCPMTVPMTVPSGTFCDKSGFDTPCQVVGRAPLPCKAGFYGHSRAATVTMTP